MNQHQSGILRLQQNVFGAYQDAGLWVNLWLVDEPWQYSSLWLAGVSSVASSYVQTLAAISHPVAAITYPVYLVI
jgi:hypothetical protein